ncbi:hypothetical protein CHS0354_004386 [Potamilus streckersoni]|uniref:Uncharacterized protein n=1 Tax=Potamilus streckersoni TaxID=2493646 RepID=A0AAE0W5P1_9BIVA|nr:hypothetical protein CHS0354_004386 [Potamilus streckersoni]
MVLAQTYFITVSNSIPETDLTLESELEYENQVTMPYVLHSGTKTISMIAQIYFHYYMNSSVQDIAQIVQKTCYKRSIKNGQNGLHLVWCWSTLQDVYTQLCKRI